MKKSTNLSPMKKPAPLLTTYECELETLLKTIIKNYRKEDKIGLLLTVEKADNFLHDTAHLFEHV